MTIGEQIKNARTNKHLTQKQLAEKINKAFSSVQKYEMNIIQPPIDVIKDISIALDVSVAYLMGWEEEYEFRDVPQGEPHNLDTIKKITAENQKSRLDEAYNKLNQTGQEKAAERVEELAMIPEYQKSSDKD